MVLNTHSDELKKHFLEAKLSLKKIRVRLGLVLVMIHEYQLTYYTKENNEIKALWWVKHVCRCGALIGSLRNEDDDGYEDFLQKYEFALFISLPVLDLSGSPLVLD